MPDLLRNRKIEAQVRLIALLTALMGGINLFSAVLPALRPRAFVLRHLLPFEVRSSSHLAAALAGFSLLLLAFSLLRRKKAAWLLTLCALGASVVSHLIKGLDWEEASLALGLAIYLWKQRAHFYASSDRPTVRHGLRVLAGAFLFTILYGATGFYLLDRHFRVDFGLRDALWQTVTMFVSFDDPGLEPLTRFGHWFADSIYSVGAATTSYALLCLLKPVLHRDPATRSERQRAKEIVETYGRSSLARFLLFDDKAYWFSPGGSVVAFALVGRTCVALGDPVGPIEDALVAILSFRQFCQRNDWQPAFFQTLPDYLSHYRAAGFDTLCIGHEAIVELETFTLEGGANKRLRNYLSRIKKAGHTVEICPTPHPDTVLEELRQVSDEWLGEQKGGEKRFSLGWFDEGYLQAGPIIVVRTPEEQISAFANIIPEYQICESSIDLMRRRREVAGGTMDLLFTELFFWAKKQGFHTFNLGLSPLAGVGEKPDDPAALRALRFLFEHVNQFYNFKGLYDFKCKFQPHWSPRYLVYAGPSALPAAVFAVVRADNASVPFWKLGR